MSFLGVIYSFCFFFLSLFGFFLFKDTVSRAILADAVALVRGDRYLTYDFSPFNLTTWGYAEATRNVDNAAWGGVLGRLITRGLPQHYNATSVYTHFPFITPTGQQYSMDNITKKLGLYKMYTFYNPIKQSHLHLILAPKVSITYLA